MGCSCNRNGRQRTRAGIPPRTATNNRIGNRSLATGRVPTQNTVQSLNAQSQLNPAGVSAEKRKLQTERRNAIRNKMNRT